MKKKLKNKMKDETYRALVIGTSIFEGVLIFLIYHSFTQGNRGWGIAFIVMFILEFIGVGTKLDKYEKNNLMR